MGLLSPWFCACRLRTRAQWRAAAAGADGQLVAHTHAAGVDGASDHRSRAIQCEGAVYGQAQALRGAGRRCLMAAPGRRRTAAGATASMPLPVCADTLTTGAPASDVPCSSRAISAHRACSLSGLARSVLVMTTAPRAIQQRQHGQVLVRLRHGAVIGGHQQQRVIDTAGAGDHGVHQAFVAGHVDEADAPPAACPVGVAQLYADAALFSSGGRSVSTPVRRAPAWSCRGRYGLRCLQSF